MTKFNFSITFTYKRFETPFKHDHLFLLISLAINNEFRYIELGELSLEVLNSEKLAIKVA